MWFGRGLVKRGSQEGKRLMRRHGGEVKLKSLTLLKIGDDKKGKGKDIDWK